MKYVIIPSAKLAPSNLPNYGEIPMALYPINGHTILHHIIASYDKSCRFVVCGFEGWDRLKNHLDRKEYDGVRLHKLSKLSDLGYTIYDAIKNIDFSKNDELIINLADTLIDNNNLVGDTIVSKNEQCHLKSKWTYFHETRGIIDLFENKKEMSINGLYRLFVGVVKIVNIEYFKLCLSDCIINNCGVSLFNALVKYSQINPFNFVEVSRWLDLGHPNEYFEAQIAVKAREFNHMSFDKNRGIIRKTSDDKIKFKGEIEWYLKLPKKLQYVSPRIFEAGTGFDNLFIEMEFYSYPTLLELLIYGNHSKEDWVRIFDKIKFILEDFKKYTTSNNDIGASLYDMYYTKTAQRFEKLKTNSQFSSFFDGDIVINGIVYKNLTDILEIIKNTVEKSLLNIDKFCIIHGDLCFANMLIDDKLNFVKLIDPRGKFGQFDIYGDQRYEIAKLYHSVDGKYDYIIKDLFDAGRDGNSINYRIKDNKDFSMFELMKQSFGDIIAGHEKEIEIIEALLFLSMIPLHGENINHQYAMLGTGIEILNRHVNIKR